MKKSPLYFLKKPLVYSPIALIVVIVLMFSVFGGNSDTRDTLTITKQTFIRQVSVSGKVVATQNADLGFEQSGRIATINAPIGTTVKKGAIIASLENGDVRAELLQKQATLEREEAKLASLTQGTRPEQLLIDQQTYDDATQSFVVAMRSAHLDAELALINQVNDLFENGSSANPDIIFVMQSYDAERAIEKGRIVVNEKLNLLKDRLNELKTPYDAAAIQTVGLIALDTLNTINIFISELTSVVESINMPQSDIDGYRATLNEAEQAIATALDTAQSAKATWNNARDSLALSKAGTTANDINAQNAAVKAARADVDSAQARIRKTLIIAPFDGTVTRMDTKVGEIIASNSSDISLMSTDSFTIESFVPEVHIAHIQTGNPATVTLDAYGEDTIFDATVSHIDPAETIRDGVSTYKVTLGFKTPDPRIRSGMTGSVSIVTLNKPDTIVVPQSVIIKRDGETYVNIMVENTAQERLVETGDSTSLGQIEITQGLSEGDRIILNPTK